ncbi:MAG: phospholipid/glycerol acyltransferase [Acidobacteriaceae bacterium]|nr:phospholipid/glycerol acyltransferase [Acidobacteriaceae bacterium]
MSFLRSVVRSFKLVWAFVVAGTELLVKRPATREGRAEWLHQFCARSLKSFGIEVEVVGRYPDRGAVISNHTGYLDIVVFAALHRCVFVSKAEIAKWPVLGWMTTMSGTVYVHRGRGGSAVQASTGMQAATDAGLPVVFFPEGTTTNGEAMLPFRSGMLAQVLGAGLPVTAAYVRYELGEGNDPEVRVSDDVAYWGDVTLAWHIFKFLSLRNVKVKVRFAEAPIKFSSDLLHRKDAAVEARVAVQELAMQSDVPQELVC